MREFICDTAGECGVQCGGHKQEHKPKYSCDERHYCHNARCMVRCNPVEEPAKLFKCACAISCPTIDCSHNKPHECHKTLTWDCPIQRKFVSCIPATRPGKPKLCPSCGADLEAWAKTLRGPCCEHAKDIAEAEADMAEARRRATGQTDEEREHGSPPELGDMVDVAGHTFIRGKVEPAETPASVKVVYEEELAKFIREHPEGPFSGAAISVLQGQPPEPETPDTMTAAVFESSVQAIIYEEIWRNAAHDSIATRATARIVKLPMVRPEAIETMTDAFRSRRMRAIILETIDALHDGTRTPGGHIRQAVERINALPEWMSR